LALTVEKGKHGHGGLREYAAAINLEYGSLRKYRLVSEAFENDIRISFSKIGWTHFSIVYSLAKWIARAEAEDWSVEELREAIRRASEKPTPPLPPGIFDVIYADPPWQYDNTGVHGAAEPFHVRR
jgi:hypothetical protein